MATSKAHKLAKRAAHERAKFRSGKRALIHKIDEALARLEPKPEDFHPHAEEGLTAPSLAIGDSAGTLARGFVVGVMALILVGLAAQVAGC